MNNAFWSALYSRLSGGTALTNLLGGTAIYHGQAPDGQALPYVVFSWQGGGDLFTTAHQDAEGLVFVRGYAESGMTAGSISEAVKTLLNRLPLTVTGWTNVDLHADGHVQFPATDKSGKTVWTSGDTYRILLDKS